MTVDSLLMIDRVDRCVGGVWLRFVVHGVERREGARDLSPGKVALNGCCFRNANPLAETAGHQRLDRAVWRECF